MKDAKPVTAPYTVNGFGGDFEVIARMIPHGVAISAKTACDRNEIETAAHIVRCVNAHEQLVAALKWCAGHPYAGGKSFGDTSIVKKALALVQP